MLTKQQRTEKEKNLLEKAKTWPTLPGGKNALHVPDEDALAQRLYAFCDEAKDRKKALTSSHGSTLEMMRQFNAGEVLNPFEITSLSDRIKRVRSDLARASSEEKGGVLALDDTIRDIFLKESLTDGSEQAEARLNALPKEQKRAILAFSKNFRQGATYGSVRTFLSLHITPAHEELFEGVGGITGLQCAYFGIKSFTDKRDDSLAYEMKVIYEPHRIAINAGNNFVLKKPNNTFSRLGIPPYDYKLAKEGGHLITWPIPGRFAATLTSRTDGLHLEHIQCESPVTTGLLCTPGYRVPFDGKKILQETEQNLKTASVDPLHAPDVSKLNLALTKLDRLIKNPTVNNTLRALAKRTSTALKIIRNRYLLSERSPHDKKTFNMRYRNTLADAQWKLEQHLPSSQALTRRQRLGRFLGRMAASFGNWLLSWVNIRSTRLAQIAEYPEHSRQLQTLLSAKGKHIDIPVPDPKATAAAEQGTKTPLTETPAPKTPATPTTAPEKVDTPQGKEEPPHPVSSHQGLTQPGLPPAKQEAGDATPQHKHPIDKP